MSNEVAVSQQSAVTIWTPRQQEVIRSTIAPDLDDTELELFAMYCQRTKLDPFARQIYGIKRGGKLTIQTSIDGFRTLAERTREYHGQLGPMWCGDDGQWRDVWLSTKPPVAAKVAVLRAGWPEPLWAVARFDAYVQKGRDGKPTPTWTQMPDVMIAKCAESLALRKAFPQVLSGLYTDEEMAQADNPEPINVRESQRQSPPKQVTARTPKPEPTTRDGHTTFTDDEMAAWAERFLDATTMEELTGVANDLAAAKPNPKQREALGTMFRERRNKLDDLPDLDEVDDSTPAEQQALT